MLRPTRSAGRGRSPGSFGATFEPQEPTQIQTNAAAGRHTVWYAWTFDTVAGWQAAVGETYYLQVNANQDTDFTVAINATFDEELPRIELTRSSSSVGVTLRVSSPRLRRLEVQAAPGWQAWETLADVRLEGTTNLGSGVEGAPPTRYFGVVA